MKIPYQKPNFDNLLLKIPESRFQDPVTFSDQKLV